MDTTRYRSGRTPTRILRNTEGDAYVAATHREAPDPNAEERYRSGAFLHEYDDGNGLYIAQPQFSDTPIYLSTIRRAWDINGVRRSARDPNGPSQLTTDGISDL